MMHFRPQDVQRFLRYVVKLPGTLILSDGKRVTACWLWIGGRSRGRGNRLPYGSFRLGKRVVRAHRFACEALAGIDCPTGHHRDHLCCNSLCVNPEHLEVVTHQINQQRKMERKNETHAEGCADSTGSVWPGVGDSEWQTPRPPLDPRTNGADSGSWPSERERQSMG